MNFRTAHCTKIFFIFSAILFFPRAAHAATILDVPFTTQAPQNQWRAEPFRDACEEASIIMVHAFYHHTALTPTNVRAQILEYVAYEKKYFGFYKDTNAGMTAKLADVRGGFSTHVVENATVADMVAELDAGRPIIFFAYSPALHNPHFGTPSNPYHVFVIVGYDEAAQQFIVNEPGTRYGKQYRYSFDTLAAANHDWVPKKNQGQGAALMIFTDK